MVDEIIDTAFSSTSKWFAVVTTTKKLLIFDTETWTLHSAIRVFPKAATKVIFDSEDKFIFISQRSGDVHRFSMNENDDQNEEKDPLLGHFSMVLDMCLSVDGKALVTADRDEKVRVTELPAGVEIRHFLLGHESYVNSVNIFENYIISSGGDSKIIVWDINKGERVLSSDRVCENPVRKISLLPFKDSVYLIVLPQQSNELYLLSFNTKEMVLSTEKTLSTKRLDDDKPVAEEEYTNFIMDLTVDVPTGTIICVGLNGIFTGQLSSTHLTPIFVSKDDAVGDLNAEWFATELMFQLQSSTDPFSYKELYEKHTLPDNIEKYKKTRDAKLGKHQSESSDTEGAGPHKRMHLDPFHAESTEDMAEEVFQHNKPPEETEDRIRKLEEHGDGHKAGVHARPLPM
uniref:WD repeat-containing protein 4 homolog n=1 Tax=Acrobeloides nanus TaxID=290746 RepID=A0A914CF67_9BILA